jgi:hypothetical protein
LLRKIGRRLSARWKSALSGLRPQPMSAQQPRAPGLVFPTLQAVQGLETSRGHRPHAEGGARNARRQEVSAVEFEPWSSRGCSSAGRAPALQAGGHRFESGHLHQHFVNRIGRKFEIFVDCRGDDWIPLACLGRPSRVEEWLQAEQATKGPRWMPRHQVPKKDAATCEKRRGVGSKR